MCSAEYGSLGCDAHAEYSEQGENHTAGVTSNTKPDSKVYVANMGPTWVLSAAGGSNVGPMNFAIWEGIGIHVMKIKVKTVLAIWIEVW